MEKKLAEAIVNQLLEIDEMRAAGIVCSLHLARDAITLFRILREENPDMDFALLMDVAQSCAISGHISAERGWRPPAPVIKNQGGIETTVYPPGADIKIPSTGTSPQVANVAPAASGIHAAQTGTHTGFRPANEKSNEAIKCKTCGEMVYPTPSKYPSGKAYFRCRKCGYLNPDGSPKPKR